MERVLVTGGAGFIGSHLVDRLINTTEVVVLDDFSTGREQNIASHIGSPNLRVIRGSITDEDTVRLALQDVDTLFHFAAQADVRLSIERPLWDFKINVLGSMILLETARLLGVKRVIFASSGGTVYGPTDVFPTPESTAFRPISNYGAAKGAVEMYLSSYAELYGIDSVSMRLGNVIGPRLTHGVIFDFYTRLRSNPNMLEVLGDGSQEKGYICVQDVVEATILLAERMQSGHTPVNVSSGERLRVSQIAQLVVNELGIPSARIVYLGGQRGWPGDVTQTDIDISLLRSMGWSPKINATDCVRKYIQWLISEFGPVFNR